MKSLKKMISFGIIAFLFGLLFSAPNIAFKSSKEWTLMFYMGTENKMYHNAKLYLQNLTKIENDKINLIALIDGDKKDDTFLYKIENNRLINLEWEKESDTGNPETLEKFCRFSIENYPANHYALLIISVGPGWQGICPDYRHGYRIFDLITHPSLENVLKNITDNGKRKIDLVSFVACLQGMIEISYEISPYANYFVAMETDNPFLDIWPDIEAIFNLTNDAEKFAVDIVKYFQPKVYHPCNNFIAKFFDSLPFKKLNIVTISTTLSAINLSKVEKIVNGIDRLSHTAVKEIDAIKYAREKANEYGKWNPKYHVFYPIYDALSLEIYAYDCNIDLYNFVENLKNYSKNEEIKNVCNEIMESINDAVLDKKTISGLDNGLSIYFPEEKFLYNKPILLRKLHSLYENLAFSKDTYWDEFLKYYLGISNLFH
ncbi:MAG: clostripain-related cysteine peptidase [Candidatus Thermoplasmatota archaeon]